MPGDSPRYTAAVSTSPDSPDSLCDVCVIVNVLAGYRRGAAGSEEPDYQLGYELALTPVQTTVRADDPDVLGRAAGEAEHILAARGWRITGDWEYAAAAIYAAAERA